MTHGPQVSEETARHRVAVLEAQLQGQRDGLMGIEAPALTPNTGSDERRAYVRGYMAGERVRGLVGPATEEPPKGLRFSERELWDRNDDPEVRQVLARLARLRAYGIEDE